MKIKLKHKYINEGAPGAILLNTVDASVEVKDHSNSEDLARAMFIGQKLKNGLFAQIIMPSACSERFIIDPVPLDLRDLMQDIPVGNGEKFHNIRGMIHDPSRTFDHASDYAKNIFGHINNLSTSGAIKGLSNNESYNYNGSYLLDEAITGATVFNAGKAVGGVANKVMLGSLDAAGGFLVGAAPGIAAIFATSYVADIIFSDVKQGGIQDDRILTRSHEQTTDRSDDNSDKNWRNQNAIAAIDLYLEKIGSSLSSVFADIVGDNTEYKEIPKWINSFISETDTNVKDYLENNSEIMKLVRDHKLQKTQSEKNAYATNLLAIEKFNKSFLGNKQINKDKAIKICSFLMDMANNPFGEYRDSDYTDIIKEITNNGIDKLNSMNLNLNGGVSDFIKSYYNSGSNNVNDSVDFNSFLSKLFEANANNSTSRGPIDLNNYYSRIKTTFRNKISSLFTLDKGELSKLPMVTDANTRMDALITAASTEIETKIEHVCRISNDSKNADIPENIARFISRHPMRAATLKNIWARHVDDLKARKKVRLDQMTAFGDNNYIAGWTASLCKDVVPEVLARMFTYRYALLLLVNNDFYGYDSNAKQILDAEFDQCQDAFMQCIDFQVINALWVHGHLYTEDGNDMIQQDDTADLGCKIINKDIYTSFLVMALIGPSIYIDQYRDLRYISKGVAATKDVLLSLNNNDDNFINNIIELARAGKKDVVNDSMAFLSAIENGAPTQAQKNAVKNAFTNIKNLIVSYKNNKINVSDTDFKKTLNVLQSMDSNDIININIEDIQSAIDNYKKTNDVSTYNSSLYSLIRIGTTPVHIPITDTPTITNLGSKKFIENVENELEKTLSSYDKFGYIMFIYLSLILDASKNLVDNNINAHIENICDITYKSMYLLLSNALNIGNETPEFLSDLLGYAEAYKLAVGANRNKKQAFDTFIAATGMHNLSDACEKDNIDGEKTIDLFLSYIENNNITPILNDIRSVVDTSTSNIGVLLDSYKPYVNATDAQYRVNNMFKVDNKNVESIEDLFKAINDKNINSTTTNNNENNSNNENNKNIDIDLLNNNGINLFIQNINGLFIYAIYLIKLSNSSLYGWYCVNSPVIAKLQLIANDRGILNALGSVTGAPSVSDIQLVWEDIRTLNGISSTNINNQQIINFIGYVAENSKNIDSLDEFNTKISNINMTDNGKRDLFNFLSTNTGFIARLSAANSIVSLFLTTIIPTPTTGTPAPTTGTPTTGTPTPP